MTYISPVDDKLDLILERTIDVTPDKLWRALVEPELVKRWFTPAPWKTVDCAIDLRVGGKFYTVMQSPEGQNFPGNSCFLEIVPEKRLVWTAALAPGFRPAAPAGEGAKECDAIIFTCVVTLQAEGGNTRYHVHVMHGTEAHMKAHAEMGFHEGWGTCLTQMIGVAKTL